MRYHWGFSTQVSGRNTHSLYLEWELGGELPRATYPTTSCYLLHPSQSTQLLLPAQAPWSTGQLAGAQLGIHVSAPLESAAPELPFPSRNLPI